MHHCKAAAEKDHEYASRESQTSTPWGKWDEFFSQTECEKCHNLLSDDGFYESG